VASTCRARAPPRRTGSPSAGSVTPVPAAAAGPVVTCGSRAGVRTGRLSAASGAVSCHLCHDDGATSARDLLEDDVPRGRAVAGADLDPAVEGLAGAVEALGRVGVHGEQGLARAD